MEHLALSLHLEPNRIHFEISPGLTVLVVDITVFALS